MSVKNYGSISCHSFLPLAPPPVAEQAQQLTQDAEEGADQIMVVVHGGSLMMRDWTASSGQGGGGYMTGFDGSHASRLEGRPEPLRASSADLTGSCVRPMVKLVQQRKGDPWWMLQNLLSTDSLQMRNSKEPRLRRPLLG